MSTEPKTERERAAILRAVRDGAFRKANADLRAIVEAMRRANERSRQLLRGRDPGGQPPPDGLIWFQGPLRLDQPLDPDR